MKNTGRKIYEVSPYYPPHLGGMESCVERIADELTLRGHDVSVITSRIGASASQSGIPGALRLPAVEIAHTPIAPLLIWELGRIPRNSLIHVHIAQAFFPEIVWLITGIRRIPYVAHVHLDVGSSGTLGILLPLYKTLLLKRVLHGAAAIIALNTQQKATIIAHYGIPSERIHIIPNGVAEEYFYSRTVTRNNVTRLLFVGRLSKQKNLPALLRALPYIKTKVTLRIVGDGELRREISDSIERLQLGNVTLVEPKFGNELVQEYRNADVFLLPSEREAFPLVLLEAMAASLPVIANDTPELREIIRDNGILCSCDNSKELAYTIDLLARSVSDRRKLSIKSHALAQQYTWKRSVNTLENLFATL